MRKIANLKQLNAEKRHLRLRREELEKAIKYDWIDLKASLKPGALADQLMTKKDAEKEGRKEASMVATGVAEAAASLTKSMVYRAENRLGKWFKRK